MKILFKTICILFTFLTCAVCVNAQNITVRGTVTDDSGEGLPGVSIVIKGQATGVITDVNGHYALSVPTGAILTYTFLGFESREIKALKEKIDVSLKPSSVALSDVVVVGYGTQSRKTLTTAIAKVSGDVIKDVPTSTLGEGLKGKIAGTRFYSNNTTPGEEVTIRIRGGSSINKSNEPLILVDGVERSLAGLNNNDIESIEVLKDAASTAIYGSRASNGVVLVTTKNGTTGMAPQITFEATIAAQEAETLYDFMNAKDYINTVRSAVAIGPHPQYNYMDGYSASSGNSESSIYSTRYLKDGETVPTGYKSMPDPLDPAKTLIFQDNDFQSEIYKRTLWQNYYAGINGGSKDIKYNASISYLDDDGIAITTGYNRMNLRNNMNVRINPKLYFSLGLDYSKTNSSEFPNQMNVISRGLATPPTQKKYNADGSPTKGYNASSPNPLFYQYYNSNKKVTKRFSGFGKLTYYILPELKIETEISTFDQNYRYSAFEKANIFNGLRTTTERYGEEERNKIEIYSTYSKTIQNHAFSILGGYSYQKYKGQTMSATVTGASSDKVPTLSAGPNKKSADSDIYKDVTIGYFGRVSYSFQKKYLLSATFREDASSRFADGHRWGFFPGVSVGWVISKENFMKNIPHVDELKLRMSYGQTGNNAVGIYDALGRYSTDAKYGGYAGIVPSTMPNYDLTWENTTQFDPGFDLSMFHNRLNIIFDYFDKRTKNLLFSKELPNTSGFSSVNTNIGEVKFYGFDLEISSINIKTKDLTWTSKLTYSFVKNKVLKLPDNGRDRNRIGGITLADGTAFGGIAEGEPLYRYYGYKVDHILQNEAEADNAMYDSKAKGFRHSDGKYVAGRKEAGDYEWKNRTGSATKNGKDYIDSQDQFFLGYTVPHSTGGFNNTISYKNFTFNIFLDWALGHSINQNSEMRYFMNTFANNYTLIDKVKNCWKKEGDMTKYARFTANDPDDGNANFSRTSDVFNYKGDYLCIREISIQYSMPRQLIHKLGMQDVTFTLAGNNLHYFTAVKGVSPEVGTSSTYGSSYYNYPPVRKVSIGVKVTF